MLQGVRCLLEEWLHWSLQSPVPFFQPLPKHIAVGGEGDGGDGDAAAAAEGITGALAGGGVAEGFTGGDGAGITGAGTTHIIIPPIILVTTVGRDTTTGVDRASLSRSELAAAN